MLYALLFVPAIVAIAFVVLRPRAKPRVLAEAVPPAATITGEVDPIAALDALLTELESTTVRIGGADELDVRAVAELEQLAEKLEAAAASLERAA
ncbi:MAG TPA: hypothetical protein VHQ89_03425 [Gaiellaceae bacterium]|jgi:hypothetical protein|nr:hypothetical protein [Gaiellaceae bacterium]